MAVNHEIVYQEEYTLGMLQRGWRLSKSIPVYDIVSFSLFGVSEQSLFESLQSFLRVNGHFVVPHFWPFLLVIPFLWDFSWRKTENFFRGAQLKRPNINELQSRKRKKNPKKYFDILTFRQTSCLLISMWVCNEKEKMKLEIKAKVIHV